MEGPSIRSGTTRLGPVTVHFPVRRLPFYWFAQDLAGTFRLAENDEAAEKLLETVAEARQGDGIEVDHEADQVIVRCKTPDALVTSVRAVAALAQPTTSLAQAEIEQFLAAASDWRQPIEIDWKPGDVFALQLLNGEFGFGRVLDSHYPTCALYEVTASDAKRPLGEIVGSRVLAHVRVGPDRLFDGRWPIIGNTPLGPVERLRAVFRGARQSWSGGTGELLEELANACNGLVPWNVKADERYYDVLLRVSRPVKANVLAAEARNKYRDEHGMNGPI
jgi:hypothetical protein